MVNFRRLIVLSVSLIALALASIANAAKTCDAAVHAGVVETTLATITRLRKAGTKTYIGEYREAHETLKRQLSTLGQRLWRWIYERDRDFPEEVALLLGERVRTMFAESQYVEFYISRPGGRRYDIVRFEVFDDVNARTRSKMIVPLASPMTTDKAIAYAKKNKIMLEADSEQPNGVQFWPEPNAVREIAVTDPEIMLRFLRR